MTDKAGPPSLDVERLAEALDNLDVHWFDDAVHGASSWNMAKELAAEYARLGTKDADRE